MTKGTPKLYNVIMDGEIIAQAFLYPENYKTQQGRDDVKKNIASGFDIHPRGLRLQPVRPPYIRVYCPIQQKEIIKSKKK